MPAPKTLLRARPLLRPQTYLRSPAQQHRTFLPNPFQSPTYPFASSQPQTLTARRTLPYPSAPIYSIIADVSSYAHFLPYCQSSTVTRWSEPDARYNRRWPSEGQLTVGWGNLTESFLSRVYCVPGRAVESVGGETETSLCESEIRHHLDGGGRLGVRHGSNGLLTHLRSKWTIEEVGKESTEVTLALEFAFANPLYTTLSAGAAPKVADVMIRAFEGRVRSLLDGNPEMVEASLSELEGSKLRR